MNRQPDEPKVPGDRSDGAAAPPDPADLEVALGYRFRDGSRLLLALTHRSFAHEVPDGAGQDNESLEFLGDAVLSFLIAERLYREFPGLDEGRLSKHKSVLEKSHTLADIARRLGIGRFMRLGRGERRSGGARNDKILSDALEAVVAAIYLDGGLAEAEAFVGRVVGPRIEQLDRLNPVTDYKSALQELTQAHGLGTPTYRVTDEAGPDHQKEFRVVVVIDGAHVGQGSGTTKRAAQQVAARKALEQLQARMATGGDGPAAGGPPAAGG